MAILLDGKAVAARLRAGLARRIAGLAFRPGLAVVRVGEDPASGVYVRNKDRAAQEAGFASRTVHLPDSTTEAELLAAIAALNADAAVDGILVQLPLPKHIRAEAAIAAVDPVKDVDGFHPLNAGRLASGLAGPVPCTPRGVMHLLTETGWPLRGLRALVLGRSQIVGRPMAQLLLGADCTVTIAHSAPWIWRRSAGGPHPGRRHLAAPARCTATGSRRRQCDRCGHQPGAGWALVGDVDFRRHRSGRVHHPRPWRGGADDHRLPAGKTRLKRPWPRRGIA
jgi:hypothetical protein